MKQKLILLIKAISMVLFFMAVITSQTQFLSSNGLICACGGSINNGGTCQGGGASNTCSKGNFLGWGTSNLNGGGGNTNIPLVVESSFISGTGSQSKFWADPDNSICVYRQTNVVLPAGSYEINVNGYILSTKNVPQQLLIRVRATEVPKDLIYTYSYSSSTKGAKLEIKTYFVIDSTMAGQKFRIEFCDDNSVASQSMKITDMSLTEASSCTGTVKLLSNNIYACLSATDLNKNPNCLKYKLNAANQYECDVCITKNPALTKVNMQGGGIGCAHIVTPNTATYSINSANTKDSNQLFYLVPATCSSGQLASTSKVAIPLYSSSNSGLFIKTSAPCREDFANIALWQVSGSSYTFAECDTSSALSYVSVALQTNSESSTGCISSSANNNAYDSRCTKYLYTSATTTFNCSLCDSANSYNKVTVNFGSSNFYTRCMVSNDNEYDANCKIYEVANPTFKCQTCTSANDLSLLIDTTSTTYHRCYSATANDRYYDVNCEKYTTSKSCMACLNSETYKLISVDFGGQVYKRCFSKNDLKYNAMCSKYNSDFECIECSDSLNPSDVYSKVKIQKGSANFTMCMQTSLGSYDAQCDWLTSQYVCQQCATNYMKVTVKIGSDNFQRCIQTTPTNNFYDSNCQKYQKNANGQYYCIDCKDTDILPMKVEISGNVYDKCLSTTDNTYDARCSQYNSSNDCVKCLSDPNELPVSVQISNDYFSKCLLVSSYTYDSNCIAYTQAFVCKTCGDDYQKISVQKDDSATYQQCIIQTDNHYDAQCSLYNHQLNCIDCTSSSKDPLPVEISSKIYQKCLVTSAQNLKIDQKCDHYDQSGVCASCKTNYLLVDQQLSGNVYKRCILTLNNENYDSKCAKYNNLWECIDCTATSEVPVSAEISSVLYFKCLSSESLKYDQKCKKYNSNFECVECTDPFVQMFSLIDKLTYSRCISKEVNNYDQYCVLYTFGRDNNYDCTTCRVNNAQIQSLTVTFQNSKVYYKCTVIQTPIDPDSPCKEQALTLGGVKTCKACKSSFFLVSGTQSNKICVSKLIQNCREYKTNGQCNICESGLPFNQQTSSCPNDSNSVIKNCKVINNNLSCVVCITNFLLINTNKECVKQVEYCQKYELGVCKTCISGYNLIQQTCIPQPALCVQVNSKGLCSKCSTGFVIENGKCTKIVTQNQATASSNPVCPSPSQYKNDKGDCVSETVSNCKKLSSPSGNCESCETGFALTSTGSCSIVCPSNTAKQIYIIQNNQCIKTSIFCLLANADGYCSVCESGFYAFGGKCIQISIGSKPSQTSLTQETDILITDANKNSYLSRVDGSRYYITGPWKDLEVWVDSERGQLYQRIANGGRIYLSGPQQGLTGYQDNLGNWYYFTSSGSKVFLQAQTTSSKGTSLVSQQLEPLQSTSEQISPSPKSSVNLQRS